MDNKVKFLRGTATEYESSIKDNDTFYYTTDDEKLYLGSKEITGGGVTIDDTLSDTSKNPVQNKVINAALNNKAELTDIPTSLPANGGNADTLDGKHAESFMQWLGYISDSDFLNNANYKVDYHCNISDGTIMGLPAASWYHIVYYMHSNQNGYGMQIAYPLNFDGVTMIRRATETTWGAWKNIADGGNAATTNHQINHYLGGGIDVLAYAASDNCPYNVNTKVRIMHSPTCPTNYGYDAANNDFWYDIYKLDNSWVTIKAYDVRGNVEFINSRVNGTWTGWVRCNDGGNAATVNGLTVQTAVPANAKFTDTTYGEATASTTGLVSTGAQTFAGNKTFNGQILPAGASAVGTAQARKIYAGTADMTAGTTALETGAIYLVYE